MIRRAQAEALLKLAEALEECEQNEVTVELPHTACDSAYLIAGQQEFGVDAIRGIDIRLAVAKLYQKSEAQE